MATKHSDQIDDAWIKTQTDFQLQLQSIYFTIWKTEFIPSNTRYGMLHVCMFLLSDAK